MKRTYSQCLADGSRTRVQRLGDAAVRAHFALWDLRISHTRYQLKAMTMQPSESERTVEMSS